MSAPDILVIGAGITGASAALALAEGGARVRVVDAYGPAAMASGWTLAGVRQSGRHPAELPLARAAVALWPALGERLGAPTHYRQNGNLRLARTRAEVRTIADLVAGQRAAGLDLALLSDHRDIAAIAPVSPAVLAASFCPTDGHADPVATVNGYLGAAQRAGAVVEAAARVDRLVEEGGNVVAAMIGGREVPVGGVLIAAGIGTNALLAPLRATVPMSVPIVTVVRTAPVPQVLAPVLGVANADLAVRQEVGGALRFTSGAEPFAGALQEEAGRPVAPVRVGRVEETIARVRTVLPLVADAPLQAVWGGLLDLTPDALPVIDRVPGLANAVVAAGFSGHGFGIGPVTGPLAADLLLGHAPSLPLDAFTFARFAAMATRPAEPLALHG